MLRAHDEGLGMKRMGEETHSVGAYAGAILGDVL